LFGITIQSSTYGQTRIGNFEITGFYQYTINPATEHANRNNFRCLSFIAGPGGTPAQFNCPPGADASGGN
jgi:hypothetical protein